MTGVQTCALPICLLELARKEGELSVYHVYPALPAVIAAFTKKTGLKAKVWRSGSEAVLQRIFTEARGNRHEVDIIQNNAPEAEAAYREKLLLEVASPHYKDVVAAAVPAHKGWAGITLDIETTEHGAWHQRIRRSESPIVYYAAARFPVADVFWYLHARSSGIRSIRFRLCRVADKASLE